MVSEHFEQKKGNDRNCMTDMEPFSLTFSKVLICVALQYSHYYINEHT